VLRWIVQRGHLLATSSDKATWDAEDLDLFSWSLTAAEMTALSAV
jgi:diketogulonate reductase-like aldo/keto reductase